MGFTQFLRKDLGLKIFCLILSLFLWAWVRYTQAPLVEKNESQTSIYIPITFQNERSDLILTKAPDKVIITVKGPPKVIDSIKPDNFMAVVDLEQVAEGNNWVDVKVKNPPGLTLIDQQPTKASVVLEKFEKSVVLVKPKITGTPKEGYSIGKPLIEPDKVEIRGAHSKLKIIKEVEVSININGADMDLKKMIQPFPKDNNDNFVSLEVFPKFIKVDLPVRPNTRAVTIPINPNITGNPAKGFKIKNVHVEPPAATILLSSKDHEAPEFLNTESISINNAKSDVEKQINIIQPQGGSLISQRGVKIKIIIRKEEK